MAKTKREQEPQIVRRDGAVCVTFVNSASHKRRAFSSYPELLAWGLESGTLSAADAGRLERAAAEQPEAAAVVVRRALELRSCLGRILLGLIDHHGPGAADLKALNSELTAVLAARRLVPAGSGCQWAWGDRGGDELDRMLWAVVQSAADVLSSRRHRRVGRCAGEDCDLLFIDRTGGSKRRWCSMRACGNRVKALRNYHDRVKPFREAAKKRALEPFRWESPNREADSHQ